MRILVDKTDTKYDLIDVGDGKVKLSSMKFPEISHIYKRTFIEGAINAGLLTEIPDQATFLEESSNFDQARSF